MGTTAAFAMNDSSSTPPETTADLDLITNLPTPPKTTADALAVTNNPPTPPENTAAALTDNPSTPPETATAELTANPPETLTADLDLIDNPPYFPETTAADPSTPEETTDAAALDMNPPETSTNRSICSLANIADSDTSAASSASRPTILDTVVLSNNTGDDLSPEDALTVRRILTPLPLYKHKRQSLKKFVRIPEPRTLEQFLPLEMFICKLCLRKINNPQENLFVFTCRHAYHFDCATSLCMRNADCRSCLYPNRDDQYRLLKLIPYSLYMERCCTRLCLDRGGGQRCCPIAAAFCV